MCFVLVLIVEGNNSAGADETTAHGRLSHHGVRALRSVCVEPDFVEVARAKIDRARIFEQSKFPVSVFVVWCGVEWS